MKVLCVFTKFNYGQEARGISIEYASFLPALQRLGHQVEHFETWDPARHPTYAELNAHLIATVRDSRPDLVFTVQRDYELWAETLQQIRHEFHACLVTWITDDSFKFHKYSRYIAPCYDAIGTTYEYRLADYEDAGIPGAFHTQWAANEAWLNPPRCASDCKYPISFVGTRYGDREALVAELRAAGLPVACFGYGWPEGPIETARIPEIMRDSVISLNFSSGFQGEGEHSRQLKARTFEVPGAGGFLLSEDAPSIQNYYRIGEEVDVFRTTEELKQKLHMYLQEPELRDRIAVAGFERTRQEHLYTVRLQALFEFALRQRKFRALAPATARVSSKATGATSDSGDRLSGTWRLVRSLLLQTCAAIWGPDRGTRAARKVTFELSIRLFGERTFSSRGLPGRLFPYV